VARPREIYDLLLDGAAVNLPATEVVVGLHYSLCCGSSAGISPNPLLRGTVDWRSPLSGRPLAELAGWLREFDPQRAALGLAAVNAALNSEADMVYEGGALLRGGAARSGIFDWFLPRLRGRRVAVCGRIAGAESLIGRVELCRFPCAGGVDPAAEAQLEEAEWLFIADHTLIDKTLPRLLELAAGATVVLCGPAVPWLDELQQFGIDWLVGMEADDPATLRSLIAEGGDLTAIERAFHYRIVPLGRALGPQRVVA